MATLFACAAFAGVGDKVVRYSTPGTDRYADGTPVLDGECYALVWSPKGTAFSGFNADGSAISSADRVVLAAPLALGGKCRDSIFQIPAKEYAELEDGEWTLCIVDTRNANGVPMGTENGKPLRVNRWGAVDGGVTVKSASTHLLLSAAADDDSSSSRGVSAATLSSVPEYAATPQIDSFEVVDGVAKLTVSDTVPYLTYTLASGSEPGALKSDSRADKVDGNAGSSIEIAAEATGSSRFFKVTRAE